MSVTNSDDLRKALEEKRNELLSGTFNRDEIMIEQAAEEFERLQHQLNREVAGTRSIYWMTSIYLEDSCPLSRDDLRVALKERNVDTRDVFPAISQYPIWPVKQAPQPRGTRIGARAINLPSGVCLKREHVEYVCEQIRRIIALPSPCAQWRRGGGEGR